MLVDRYRTTKPVLYAIVAIFAVVNLALFLLNQGFDDSLQISAVAERFAKRDLSLPASGSSDLALEIKRFQGRYGLVKALTGRQGMSDRDGDSAMGAVGVYTDKVKGWLVVPLQMTKKGKEWSVIHVLPPTEFQYENQG